MSGPLPPSSDEKSEANLPASRSSARIASLRQKLQPPDYAAMNAGKPAGAGQGTDSSSSENDKPDSESSASLEEGNEESKAVSDEEAAEEGEEQVQGEPDGNGQFLPENDGADDGNDSNTPKSTPAVPRRRGRPPKDPSGSQQKKTRSSARKKTFDNKEKERLVSQFAGCQGEGIDGPDAQATFALANRQIYPAGLRLFRQDSPDKPRQELGIIRPGSVVHLCVHGKEVLRRLVVVPFLDVAGDPWPNFLAVPVDSTTTVDQYAYSGGDLCSIEQQLSTSTLPATEIARLRTEANEALKGAALTPGQQLPKSRATGKRHCSQSSAGGRGKSRRQSGTSGGAARGGRGGRRGIGGYELRSLGSPSAATPSDSSSQQQLSRLQPKLDGLVSERFMEKIVGTMVEGFVRQAEAISRHQHA